MDSQPDMADPQGAPTRTLESSLDSSLESVDTAEQTVLDVAQTVGFDEDSRGDLGLAIREAMVNAVVHGNRYSAEKKVKLTISGARDSIKVIILDQGEGFDPSAVADPLAEDNLMKQSGRGLLLIQAFVDEFSVRKSPEGGAEVTMIKYLPAA
jgi:serine/threonine-protein kinase RsbW